MYIYSLTLFDVYKSLGEKRQLAWAKGQYFYDKNHHGSLLVSVDLSNPKEVKILKELLSKENSSFNIVTLFGLDNIIRIITIFSCQMFLSS